MYIISCHKKSNSNVKPSLVYVSNSTGHNFTKTITCAHKFHSMAFCKNIRDELLQIADNVSILRVRWETLHEENIN